MTRQNAFYTYCAILLVLFLSLILTPSGYFGRFFGNMNPTIIFLILSVLSLFTFHYLKRFDLLISGRDIWKGLRVVPGLAVSFFIVVLIADIRWGFPRDMNIPFPHALTFYPVIGLMAEILLHLLPISLLLFFLSLFGGRKLSEDFRIKLAFFLVALLEAFYQAHFSYLADPSKMNLVVFVFFHLLVFNLVQFWLFRKFGFLVLYALRLIYYLFWHILWGVWRLDFLF